MRNKTVINIGGTARSGSTLLNLILANDDRAISVGEVHALFRPVRVHHHEEIQRLKDSDETWTEIIKQGEKDLYNNLFEAYPNVEFIIDSSKNYFWILEQNQNCLNSGIDYKNVLIYKSPHEIANSFLKRNSIWENTYINYHRRYFSILDNFFIVAYKDLIKDQNTLQALCDWIGLPYFDKKMDYWTRESNHFFGSRTPQGKSTIRYDKPNYPDLDSIVESQIVRKPIIREIWNYLESNKQSVISRESTIIKELILNKNNLQYIRIQQNLRILYRKYFPENYFKETNK